MITVDLYESLHHVWDALCTRYDVSCELPPISSLLERVDISTSDLAAQCVLVNMLSDIMESVGRFSPWYKRPASAFGVMLQRRGGQRRPEWGLTSAACDTYAALLGQLATAIEHNVGVILATQFVDDLDQRPAPDGPCRTAACCCRPPRMILVYHAVTADAEIICNACQQPFQER
ncbi:MAG: hypothetical protein GYB65_17130 [Chloroflexi bacterium]|nr:hypothetical protein [Chloroflexota bacterium]